MTLRQLVVTLKHMAGKHPQKTHAGSRGSANKPTTLTDKDYAEAVNSINIQGANVKVTQHSTDQLGRRNIVGVIEGSGGELLGKFDYTVSEDGTHMSPDYLKIYYQHTGLGSKFVKSMESKLGELGVGESSVTATNVGGLFWAKQGYEFRDTSDLKYFRERDSNHCMMTSMESYQQISWSIL